MCGRGPNSRCRRVCKLFELFCRQTWMQPYVQLQTRMQTLLRPNEVVNCMYAMSAKCACNKVAIFEFLVNVVQNTSNVSAVTYFLSS